MTYRIFPRLLLRLFKLKPTFKPLRKAVKVSEGKLDGRCQVYVRYHKFIAILTHGCTFGLDMYTLRLSFITSTGSLVCLRAYMCERCATSRHH